MKLRTLVFAIVVLAMGTLVSLNGCGGSGGSTPPPPPGKIQHVVVIFQENRTPDNLFQDPILIAHGAHIASSGKTSTGQIVPLKPTPLAEAWDMGHSHHNFLAAWDNGAMDGFDLDVVFCPQGQQNCAPPDPEYYYVQPSDVQPYFTMAETYTFGDRMFQTNQGPIIEDMFGLTTVGPGDGYADSRADDLSDCFNLNQTPLQFQTIAAPLKAEYFQNDKTPVKDPDDD